jgi:cytosine/adenosine deaminase-related metal-dependent hydrolase
LDGTSAELREGCVRVAAGTIAEVGEGPEPGDRVIDCRGRTIVPGLIDAHFHAYGASLSLLEIETSPLSYLALAGARRLAGALGRGFTTVRDPGGGDAGLARAIREGLTAAPRYLFCGPALSQTGGHGDPRPPELGCCLGGGHMAEVVDGVDALRRAARERLRSGAHAIKIMASGGVISPSDPLRVPQYSPEEIRVVAQEATRRGSYVAAHAYSAEAIAVAVANGVRSIEHGNLLDAPAAALMAERGAFLVPTLVTYDAMERRGAELGLAPVVRAGFQAFNAGDVGECLAHIPPDLIINLAELPEPQHGRKAWRQGFEMMRHAFPRPSGRNRGHRGRSGQDRRSGAVPRYPHRRVPRLPRDRAHRRVRQPRVLPHRRRPHCRGVDLLGYGQPVPPAQLASVLPGGGADTQGLRAMAL